MIVPYKAGFKEGESVEWEIDGMQKIYLCVAFFLLPIMILLISYLFISTFITKSESVCAVISVGMFALTAIVVFVVHKKFYNPAKLHVMGE